MSTCCEYKFLASATAKQSQLNNQHVQAKKEVSNFHKQEEVKTIVEKLTGIEQDEDDESLTCDSVVASELESLRSQLKNL